MLLYCSLIVFLLSYRCFAQYRQGTAEYKQAWLQGTATLLNEIESNPDVQYIFDPDSALIDNTFYVNNFPLPEEYRISIAIDPCRYLPYNCCMNVFGTPEYTSLIDNGLEAERQVKYAVLGDESAVQINYQSVFEDASLVPVTEIRAADDDAVIDLSCERLGSPEIYCYGKNYAFRRSSFRPNCTDNNITLNSLSGCQSPVDGSYHRHCVQIGYSQNAFIGQCQGEDLSECGTYLEVHMVQGSPYQKESDVIADVLLDTRNVSGMYTTMLPLTWMGNHSKVLCSYTETFLRVGSIVYILPTAPRCCCPIPATPSARGGSFFCPKGASGDGPFAAYSKSIADNILVDSLQRTYPFCQNDLYGADRLMCSRLGVHDRRYFTVNCSASRQLISNRLTSYGSEDLFGFDYPGQCPYFKGCAMAANGKCFGTDYEFTFIGRVGRVVSLDSSGAVPFAMVTFNDGRTVYKIEQQYIQLEYRKKSMYEVWWVLRTKTSRVVQKRKGFNVTSPRCTFDLTNNRYFPFAKLDSEGKQLDSAYF